MSVPFLVVHTWNG